MCDKLWQAKKALNTLFSGFPNRFGFAPPESMRLLNHPCRPWWSWVWDCRIWYIGYLSWLSASGIAILRASNRWARVTSSPLLMKQSQRVSRHFGHPWKSSSNVGNTGVQPEIPKKISTLRHVIWVYNSKSQGLWDPLMLLTLNTC